MFKDNDRISNKEAGFFIIAALLQTGTIMGARTMTKEVGPDAWISQIMTYLFFLPFLLIIIKLGQRFHKHGFAEYSRIIAGSFIGWVLSAVLVVYWLFLAARVINLITGMVNLTLLDTTPNIVVAMSFMLVAVYVSWHGIEPLCRISLLISIVIIPAIIITSITVIPKFDIDNFLPFMANGPLPVMKFSFSQISDQEEMTFLLFLIPFLDKPRKAAKPVLSVICALIVFDILAKLIHIGVLGVDLTKLRVMPGIASLEIAEFPGAFVEKLSVVFSGLWIMLAFPTTCGHLYAMSHTLSQMFRTKSHRPFLIPLVGIIYFISTIPKNTLEAEKFYKFMQPYGMVVLAVIPTLLYLIAAIRRLKDD